MHFQPKQVNLVLDSLLIIVDPTVYYKQKKLVTQVKRRTPCHFLFFIFILTLPGNQYFDETRKCTSKLFQINVIKDLVEDYTIKNDFIFHIILHKNLSVWLPGPK